MTTKVHNIKRKMPIIGIIGGAGPDATVDFQLKLLRAMKVQLNICSDQDHYRIIVDNNSEIPDRTEAVLHAGKSPVPYLLDSLRFMEYCGVDLLAIPCNTAHFYYDNLQAATSAKIVNMIDAVVDFIQLHYKNATKVGLISTVAVTHSKLYHIPLSKYNIEVVVPDIELQASILQAIYGIKAGFYTDNDILSSRQQEKLYRIYSQHVASNSKICNIKLLKTPLEILQESILYLQQKGVRHIILGCSEIPLLINNRNYKGESIIIDPNLILAHKTIKLAKKFARLSKINNQ